MIKCSVYFLSKCLLETSEIMDFVMIFVLGSKCNLQLGNGCIEQKNEQLGDVLPSEMFNCT